MIPKDFESNIIDYLAQDKFYDAVRYASTVFGGLVIAKRVVENIQKELEPTAAPKSTSHNPCTTATGSERRVSYSTGY